MSQSLFKEYITSKKDLTIPFAGYNINLKGNDTYSHRTGLFPKGLDVLNKEKYGVIQSSDRTLRDGLPYTRGADKKILSSEIRKPDVNNVAMVWLEPSTFAASRGGVDRLQSPTELLLSQNTFPDGTPKQSLPTDPDEYNKKEYANFASALNRAQILGQNPRYADEARDIVNDAWIRLRRFAPTIYEILIQARRGRETGIPQPPPAPPAPSSSEQATREEIKEVKKNLKKKPKKIPKPPTSPKSPKGPPPPPNNKPGQAVLSLEQVKSIKLKKDTTHEQKDLEPVYFDNAPDAFNQLQQIIRPFIEGDSPMFRGTAGVRVVTSILDELLASNIREKPVLIQYLQQILRSMYDAGMLKPTKKQIKEFIKNYLIDNPLVKQADLLP